jgi:hypothetical protein
MGNIERWAVEKEHIRERGWTGENVLSFCFAVAGGANEIAAVLNQHAGAVQERDELRNMLIRALDAVALLDHPQED